MRRLVLRSLLLIIPGLLALGALAIWWLIGSPTRGQLRSWLNDPTVRPTLITRLVAPCPGAPFLLPSAGFVGFLYGDSTIPYTPLNPHTGIDIFGDGAPGTVPVYTAYGGYLTRLADWKSAVIIRIPRDPLDPSRQVWTYYAHMASKNGDESFISAEFPPGTIEKPVSQGTLLGYQGLFSGNGAPIAMHVHFSVVLSDLDGTFKNEGRFGNTLDPSPYFGLTLDARRSLTIPVRCGP